ncbi:MAG: hypothetical protein GY832_33360 [Chloroflexi bacterium]|nr:hypothetical protein [Chloroflexota bacterium]
MKAIYWLLPDLLAGRPGPGMSSWDLEGIWNEGLRTIITLIRGDEPAIQATGFRHYQVPLNSWLAILPCTRQRLVQRMLPVIDLVAAEVAAGRPTLVHCYAGKDRTGAILAGYLIRYQGLSPEEAFRLLRQINPRAMTAPGFHRLPKLLKFAQDR